MIDSGLRLDMFLSADVENTSERYGQKESCHLTRCQPRG